MKTIYKNKLTNGQIELVGTTAFDYRFKFVDDDSDAVFSLTPNDLDRYWTKIETVFGEELLNG